MDVLLKDIDDSPITRIYRLPRPLTKRRLAAAISAICREHVIRCKKKLGSGMYGVVSAPPSLCVRPFMDLEIASDKIITIPVVVKEIHSFHDASFGILSHAGRMYVWDDNALTNEAFFHAFTNLLYKKKKSPHLPLMLGATICDDRKDIVTRIILERQGKDDIEEYTGTRTSDNNFFITNHNPFVYGEWFSTFEQLKTFALRTMTTTAHGRDYHIILPRIRRRVLLSSILDTLVISFLYTFMVLLRYDFFLRDMHPENLLIHWLGPNSYFYDTGIENLREIGYEYRRGHRLVIPLFGFILRINDLGMSVFHPRPDIFFIGQCGRGCRLNVEKLPLDASGILHHFFSTLLEKLPFIENSVIGCASFRREILSVPYTNRALDPVRLLDRFEKKYGAKKDWKPDNHRSILVRP